MRSRNGPTSYHSGIFMASAKSGMPRYNIGRARIMVITLLRFLVDAKNHYFVHTNYEFRWTM